MNSDTDTVHVRYMVDDVAAPCTSTDALGCAASNHQGPLRGRKTRHRAAAAQRPDSSADEHALRHAAWPRG